MKLTHTQKDHLAKLYRAPRSGLREGKGTRSPTLHLLRKLGLARRAISGGSWKWVITAAGKVLAEGRGIGPASAFMDLGIGQHFTLPGSPRVYMKINRHGASLDQLAVCTATGRALNCEQISPYTDVYVANEAARVRRMHEYDKAELEEDR